MLGEVLNMLSVFSQSFLDELNDVEWDQDDPDYDDRYSLNSPGFINDDNYEDVLVDTIENPQEEDFGPEQPEFQQPEELLPVSREQLGIPPESQEIEYDQPVQLAYDGIDGKEIISFEYTNRHGIYAGVRTVEPHYTFMAQSTGNEVLVTYDRGQQDIRAFILGNIHPFGVRYKGLHFQPRSEIMSGIA